MSIFGMFKPSVEKMKANGDVQGLIGALQNEKDPKVRAAAVEALGEIGGTQAIEPLIAAIRDSDDDVKFNASFALRKIEDPRVVELLLPLLKDSSSNVRMTIGQILRDIKDTRSVVPLLVVVCEDENQGVRGIAASALEEICGVDGKEILILRGYMLSVEQFFLFTFERGMTRDDINRLLGQPQDWVMTNEGKRKELWTFKSDDFGYILELEEGGKPYLHRKRK